MSHTRLQWHKNGKDGTWSPLFGRESHALLEERIRGYSYNMMHSLDMEIIVISETEYIHTWLAHWGMNVDHFKMLPVEEP